MLVLTRKQNEKIRIGDSIVITVVRMKGKGVRLGIEAPSDVNILRGELVFETTAEENTKENTKENTAAKVVVEEPTQDQTIRKTAKARVNGSHRNSASEWPSGRREEQGGPSWPTALMDTVL